ncbi:MAG: PT domain-containing protein, partial [Clostridia bacterium]|nr:PT domain-containing protein [Clostridia bacterium]
VISAGEYDEFTGHYEWWIGEMASGAYEDATKLAESLKWYFSWDGAEYFHVAAQWDAGQGAAQTHPAGDLFGDYNAKEAGEIDDVVNADDFLGWGPGLQVVSNEQSSKYPEWSRFYYTVGENSVDGGYITGTFSDQNGQAGHPYQAVGGTDFDFSYNGTVVTAEWKIPVFQLCETFDPAKGTANFKASITVSGGLYTADIAAEAEAGASTAPYNYGARIGLRGFNADSSLEDSGPATFLLTKNEVPQVDVPTTQPTEGPTTQPTEGPTTNDTEEPTTAPVVPGPGDVNTNDTIGGGNDDPQPTDTTTTVGDDEPIVTPNPEVPDDNKPGDDKPVIENKPVDTKPVNPGNGQGAAQTGDPMIIAAVVSAISACGVMIAKKRK